ncbi:MAG: penicillin-binding protein 2 [Firmicutes bacterium]|nr:penicillin-binding protein 2 [Bacillota bacterium]
MQTQREARMIIAFCAIIICLLSLVARLGYIQLEQSDKLTRMALARDTKTVGLEQYPRGEILDKDGNSLTGSYKTNRIVIYPSAVVDKNKSAQNLARVLGVEPSDIRPFLQDKPSYLPFDVTSGQAELIRNNTGSGVAVLPVKHRYGPDPVAVHITGHLGKIQSRANLESLEGTGDKEYGYDDWVGVMGLERYYEHLLKGEFPVQRASVIMDAQQRIISKEIRLENSVNVDPERYNVITTIDLDVQQVVERVLDRSVKKGAVVVMQPNTGDIIASASRPDFNPAPAKIPVDEITKGVFVNRATALFQPGSIFKLVLACAALEEGVADPGTTFYCRGAQDSPIRCWHSPGHGEINLFDAVVNSCNPAFVQLGQELGAERIISYAEKLGLSATDTTGLPEEPNTRQNLQAIAEPYNLANSSIGQGPVLATPVQITAMMNTIASGDVYYAPRIVGELDSLQGNDLQFPVAAGIRVLSPSTAGTLQKMLEGVTSNGVGSAAFVDIHGSAGKTGSAQVQSQSGDSINAWFSGYVPVAQPRYVITVLVQNGASGGETAAPVFKEIARGLMQLDH